MIVRHLVTPGWASVVLKRYPEAQLRSMYAYPVANALISVLGIGGGELV